MNVKVPGCGFVRFGGRGDLVVACQKAVAVVEGVMWLEMQGSTCLRMC